MQLFRMFSTNQYKGTKGYLASQKKYEVLRTCIYFAISISLFIAGYVTTKTRMNLLTLVAVLGCLPASNSAVQMIMFLRFKGCSEAATVQISAHAGELSGLYDMVFTSYQKNYNVAHLVVKGNTVCGYSEDVKFDENAFYKHIDGMLKNDGFKNVTVKIFMDLNKYTARLEQLKELEADDSITQGIITALKSVSL